MWPRWKDNPYLDDLRVGLREAGLEVDDADPRVIARRRGILHIQWPDAIWSGRLAGRLLRLVDVTTLLLVAMLRRVPVVVTVHNLEGHESSGRFAQIVADAVIRRASRVVVLSESGRARLADRGLVEQSAVEVIEHMDWAERYPPMDRSAASTVLGVPDGRGLLVGWFGLIRPYKGVEALVDLVVDDGSTDAPLRLMLLGRALDSSVATGLAERVAASGRAVHMDRRVSDEEIRALCAVADAVVFPFESVENSGSVIAALAAGATVIAPRLGALVDLERHPALRLYDGELTADTIRRIVTSGMASTGVDPTCSREAIAERHRKLYESVTSR
jgi:beta-1,4-mannosyltransferase